MCRGCGSLISLGFDDSVGPTNDGRPRQYCRICERNEQPGALDGAVQDKSVGVVAKRESTATAASSKMDVIAVPYVFRYLCAEMACMGIHLNVSVA